jgi:hypothetical protein
MALDVPAVLQAQRAEIVVGQLALQVAFQLVAELGSPLVDDLAVKGGVLVHGAGLGRKEGGLSQPMTCTLGRPHILEKYI